MISNYRSEQDGFQFKNGEVNTRMLLARDSEPIEILRVDEARIVRSRGGDVTAVSQIVLAEIYTTHITHS